MYLSTDSNIDARGAASKMAKSTAEYLILFAVPGGSNRFTTYILVSLNALPSIANIQMPLVPICPPFTPGQVVVRPITARPGPQLIPTVQSPPVALDQRIPAVQSPASGLHPACLTTT